MSEGAQALIKRIADMGATEFQEAGFGSLAENVPGARPDGSSDLARAYLRVFTSPEGREVLEDLIGRTVVHATWQPGAGSDFGYWRQGQNDLVMMIIGMMAKAREEAGNADES